MKKKFLRVKYVICFVCLLLSGLSSVYADINFETDFGVGFTWVDDEDTDFGAYAHINFGWTSAKFEKETREVTEHERRVHGWSGAYITEKNKYVEPFNFDILFDISLGYPLSLGGGILNLYLFTPSIFVIGVSVGGGYAAYYSGFDTIVHGPYIRGAIPISINGGNMSIGAIFDYFFFEGPNMQIGGYLKYCF
jgi:hypothetical protein